MWISPAAPARQGKLRQANASVQCTRHRRLRLQPRTRWARPRVLAHSSVGALRGRDERQARAESQRQLNSHRPSLPDHRARSARSSPRFGPSPSPSPRAGGLLEFLRHGVFDPLNGYLRSHMTLPTRRRGKARDPQRKDGHFRIRRGCSERFIVESNPPGFSAQGTLDYDGCDVKREVTLKIGQLQERSRVGEAHRRKTRASSAAGGTRPASRQSSRRMKT